MKFRETRLKKIRKLVKENRIESQEILLDALVSEGISVTQATLSRDLKYLKVGKISDGQSGYFYTLPGEESAPDTIKAYLQDLERGFLSIDFSGDNIALIKTVAGHASSVAAALDKLDFSQILGTVAGDDTIIIVLKEDSNRESLVNRLRSVMPNEEL